MQSALLFDLYEQSEYSYAGDSNARAHRCVLTVKSKNKDRERNSTQIHSDCIPLCADEPLVGLFCSPNRLLFD